MRKKKKTRFLWKKKKMLRVRWPNTSVEASTCIAENRSNKFILFKLYYFNVLKIDGSMWTRLNFLSFSILYYFCVFLHISFHFIVAECSFFPLMEFLLWRTKESIYYWRAVFVNYNSGHLHKLRCFKFVERHISYEFTQTSWPLSVLLRIFMRERMR